MFKPLLAMHSALATIAKPGHHGAPCKTGVTLTELTGLSLAAITVRGNQTADLSAAIKREFGAPLPVWPGRTAQDSAAFVWSGYDQWLAVGAAADNFVQRLSSCAGALGSVTDLTGSVACSATAKAPSIWLACASPPVWADSAIASALSP